MIDWSSDVCSSDLDFATYLERIQYQGPYKAAQDVLRALHIRHTQAIAFECLSPFTGTAVSLDVDALIEKFTVQKRGGYCYEHNTLFQHILRDIGFKAQGLAARVRLNVPVDVATPRTHMLLLRSEEHTSELQSLMRTSYAV